MEREFLENLRVGEQALPQDMVDQIWQAHETALQQLSTQHAQEVKNLQFASAVKEVIQANKGRNLKAITALLDMEALQQQNDPKAVEQAVAMLKKEHGYLFCEENTKPPYAKGTGMQTDIGEPASNTLAGALRERFRCR